MSKTTRLLLDLHESSDAERTRSFGVNPTPENAKKVLEKLESFGKKGIKGFDMAVAILSILRGEEEHFALATDKNAPMTPLPFNFLFPSAKNSSDTDHGIYLGFRYGLHILPKNMDEITLHETGFDHIRAVIATESESNRSLLRQVSAGPEDSVFELGYFGAFPADTERVESFMVLPTVEAVELVDLAT